jgi:hypothetical protein
MRSLNEPFPAPDGPSASRPARHVVPSSERAGPWSAETDARDSRKPPPVAARRAHLWWFVAGLASIGAPGCAWTVQLLSVPSGAHVQLDDGSILATPTSLRVDGPEDRHILVTHPGFLPLHVDLRATEGARGLDAAVWMDGRRELTFLLQPEAPAVGEELSAP